MSGERLGPFRIEALLGRGSMGAVYRGVHEATGRTAAIKVLRVKEEEQSTLFRFQRATEALRQCRHPNIVRFLGSGQSRSAGVMYLAMEYISGPTLQDVLAERGMLPWPEVVGLGLQICESLQSLHQRGVVHRNLKPSHFMLTEERQVKLIGFGLAKFLDRATPPTACGRIVGTPGYLAPEQIRGTPAVSPKTDLYALGIVFYEMLTGLPAFEGRSPIVLMHSHLGSPPPRPSDRAGRVPKALDNAVVRLMAKSPPDRPEDAAEVARVLSQLRDKEWQPLVKQAPSNPLRLRLWRGLLQGELRRIARDASSHLYPADPLWDRELDA